MFQYTKHLINSTESITKALKMLNGLAQDAILFLVNHEKQLVGSLTDGDVRRGLIKGLIMTDSLSDFCNNQPKYLNKSNYTIDRVMELRRDNYQVIPVVDSELRVVNVINFNLQKSYLPVDAVVMAGGMGSRLKPLTNNVPKPLLPVGDKAIIDYNIDGLRKYGVDDYWISIRYLGQQLKDHLDAGSSMGVNIQYVEEDEPLGTIGAVSKIDNFAHDVVLVTNSDILTNLNYEDFFCYFLEKDADMAVVTIPYSVNIPYAVMETNGHQVISFKEKPTYTYYSNGGIYLIKKEMLEKIPVNSFYNSTDLMEAIIQEGGNLVSYPMRQYWLDIGKHEDYQKAQKDIKHLQF